MPTPNLVQARALVKKAYTLLSISADPEADAENAAALLSRALPLMEADPASTSPKYLTEAAVIDAFWKENQEFESERRFNRRHSDYSMDVQNAFDDFIDELTRAEEISEDLAGIITLG